MARIEVVRDHWPSDLNGAYFWIGNDAILYNEWLMGDPDTPRDKPDPTFELAPEEVDQLVLKWLRGPIGPVGPMGPMGASG
jgi:hypothetical protein